jgi:hypothetical protein
MRGVILIQPPRCRSFGPALNGEIRREPPAAHTRSKWDGEGAAFGPPFLFAATPAKFTFKKGEEPNESESPTRGESEALRALHKAIKKHGVVTPKGDASRPAR